MARNAIIFPGQGAQKVGMGMDFVEAHRPAREVFERATSVLGFDVAELCFRGPVQELERTDLQQPAIFVTSMAIWAAYRSTGATVNEFTAAGGLSLGEYSALCAAEAMEFEDALRLVHLRGKLMQSAAETVPSGMVSLVGADEKGARELCAAAAEGDVLVAANFNCPGQVVISGTSAACQRAVALAEKFGYRAVPLAVAGAFHSAIMEPAAKELGRALEQTRVLQPRIRVVANVDAEYHVDPAAIRRSLASQLTSPVQWQRCVQRLIADGVEEFVEIGPGRVLTGLLRKIDRNVAVRNVSTADALGAVAA